LIEDKGPYYKYTAANVLENENFKPYWNRSILTDKIIPFNRPDIIFMNKKTKNNFLMGIALPYSHNLAKTIPTNKTSTKNWRMKYVLCGSKKAAQVIPIVISSTGVIPKLLSQSLTRPNLHPNTHTQLQKSVILGICSNVRNFLNYK